MLEVSNITRAFGSKKVLRGVNFTLPESCIAGLIGPSGGGKSVLLKILGHSCRTDAGSVSFGETCHLGDVALMFQEGALFDSLSVYDNVAFPLVAGHVPTTSLPAEKREEVCERVGSILAKVGLTKAAYKMPAQISGGMRRRVSLARALVSKPKILLLDDPTSGLDPVASSVIMDLISELHKDYRPTTLIVSHDLRRLLPRVEQIIALFGGTNVFQGTLDDLIHCPIPQIRGFVSCRYELDSKNEQEQPRQ